MNKQLLVTAFLILFSCGQDEIKNIKLRPLTYPGSPNFNLKANVKQYTQLRYDAVEKFGEPVIKTKDLSEYHGSSSKFVFNNKGDLIEETIEQVKFGDYIQEKDKLDFEIVINTKMYKIEYDNNENIVEYNAVDSDSTASSHTFKYDDNGLLIETNFFRYGRLSSRLKYSYPERRGEDLKSEINRYYYGGDGELVDKTNFLYHNNGKLLREYHSNDDHTNSSHLIYYYYDNKGNIIKEDSTTITGISERTFEYKYDSKNNWIMCIEYLNDKPLKIIKRDIEYYDDIPTLSLKDSLKFKDGEYINKRKFIDSCVKAYLNYNTVNSEGICNCIIEKFAKKFSSIEFESLAEKSMIIGQSTIESAANLARNKKIQKITISCLKSFHEIADSFPNLPKTKESVELAAKLHLQELKLQNIEEYNELSMYVNMKDYSECFIRTLRAELGAEMKKALSNDSEFMQKMEAIQIRCLDSNLK